MEYQAYILRAIADQLGVQPLSKVALQPGISAAYRLTVRYHDRRAADSLATLKRFGREETASLEVVYRALFDGKPLLHTIDAERYTAFTTGLQTARFDNLTDQTNIPPHGVDLWLLERAAGGFAKSIILAPELTSNVYARIVYMVGTVLPEAIREVRAS